MSPGLPLAVVMLAAPLGLAVLGGVVAVHACLPVSGGWARAGLRLALIRPDEACPEGLSLGADPDQALPVVLALTLPAAAAHALLLGGVAGVVGAARRALLAFARRLSPAPRASGTPPLPADPGPAWVPSGPQPPARLVAGRRPRRRGPPVLLPASA